MKKILIIIGVVIIIFSMAKIKDLSPKFKIPLAEKELELQMGQVPMGMNQGGLNMYSNKFKRGYGDAVFGSDENGIWLGGAEFDDSPFNVDMDGALAAKSATFKDEDNTTIIDAGGLVSINNFKNGTVSASSEQLIIGTSYVDLDSMELITPEFDRSVVALILFTCQHRVIPNDGNAYAASVNFVLEKDEVVIPQTYMTKYAEGDPAISWAHDGQGWVTTTCHFLTDLSAGIHNLKMQWRMIQYSGTGKGGCYARTFSFTVLGS